jgi:hypothetical protein
MVGAFAFASMNVVALAGLIVVAQHTNLANNESKTVTIAVSAPSDRGRNLP